jgi:Small subunit of serine palmitoyltransferase-like
MACENASANPSFISRIDKKIQLMYYQYSVTLPIYGLTRGEKIVLNSLVILSISLVLRLVLFFLAAGINALIAFSQDQLFIYSFLICSGLLIRTFVYGPWKAIYGLSKAQRGVLAGSGVQGSGKQH